MRRWFRSKEEDRAESLEERENLPAEETESGPEAPMEAPELSPEEGREAPSEAVAPSPPEAATPSPESRGGFFRRFLKKGPAEETPQPFPAELAPEEPRPELPPETDLETSQPSGAEPIPKILAPCETEIVSELPEVPPQVTEELTEEARRGLFRRIREGLSRTREALSGGLDRLFAGRKEVDAALLEELEELLISADLGVDTALHLIQGLQEKVKRRELGEVARLKQALQEGMLALLAGPPPREITARPWVVLTVGVNGVGKTTTIAKLAYQDRLQGLNPLLIAADTFRAAAVEQLEIWGQRVGAPVIKQKTGADPAAVVFDGLAAAQARGVDRVYIDTAGRLHTKVNLMEELKKVHRTAAKKLPGAPHEVLLILDATTGQNALSQAHLFHEAVGVSGIILTKLDGTAKGGVALAVVHETGIPLRYLGVGEGLEDLRPFDAQAFVAAILG